MTNRRSFLTALLAVPMAAVSAVSNVVHGRHSLQSAVNEGVNPDWDGSFGGQKAIRELWIALEPPRGVYYSIDGGPLVKTPWPMLPAVPLRIELPPWVQDKMPTVTFKSAGAEKFRVYDSGVDEPWYRSVPWPARQAEDAI